MLEAKAKDQGHKSKCSPKKKVFTKIFQAISKKRKKRSSQKFFKRSPLKIVFQKIFQALHKILTFQKIVLFSRTPPLVFITKSRNLTTDNSISFQSGVEEKKRAIKFAIPRIWRESTNHTNDCYFCLVDPSKRRTGKNVLAIVYPSIPPSIAPVPHSDQLPVPIPTRCQDPVSADESTTDEDDITIDDYVLNSNLEEKKPLYPNQKDLNDVIRDLGLTKSNAELLTSQLKP